jgi:hypothetical protein
MSANTKRWIIAIILTPLIFVTLWLSTLAIVTIASLLPGWSLIFLIFIMTVIIVKNLILDVGR